MERMYAAQVAVAALLLRLEARAADRAGDDGDDDAPPAQRRRLLVARSEEIRRVSLTTHPTMADMNQLHLEDLGPVSSDDESTAHASPQKAGTTRANTEDGGLHKEVLADGTGRDCPEPGDEVTGATPLGGGPSSSSRPAAVDTVGTNAKHLLDNNTVNRCRSSISCVDDQAVEPMAGLNMIHDVS
jgi:hypothetical protein